MRFAVCTRGAAAVFAAALIAGCGLGPGDKSRGIATLTVTRDYGSQRLVEADIQDPSESETVLRALDREADLETRYGGGFVQSIDGLAGATNAGLTFDWFFYVNGIESPVGSAERSIAAGDRIWWDYRDWRAAMRVPAVVGSWPEPFLQSSTEGLRLDVRVECAVSGGACRTASARLADQGVTATTVRLGSDQSADALRVVVGEWSDIHGDDAAALLDQGPQSSGVFARISSGPDTNELEALAISGEVSARLGAGAGLVAAVRDGGKPPTWLVTGVDRAGVAAAARALDVAVLRDHYAVAVAAGSDRSLALPVIEG